MELQELENILSNIRNTISYIDKYYDYELKEIKETTQYSYIETETFNLYKGGLIIIYKHESDYQTYIEFYFNKTTYWLEAVNTYDKYSVKASSISKKGIKTIKKATFIRNLNKLLEAIENECLHGGADLIA